MITEKPASWPYLMSDLADDCVQCMWHHQHNYVALLCARPCETCILQNILPSLRFEACWHAGFVLVQQDQNYFNEIHYLKRKNWYQVDFMEVDLMASWSHKSWPHEIWSHGSWSHGKLISWQVDLMASWSHGSWSHGKLISWKLIWWQVDLVASLVPRLSPHPNIFIFHRGEGRAWKQS